MGRMRAKRSIVNSLLSASLILVSILAWGSLQASEGGGFIHCKEGSEDVAKVIVHHVADNHNWHIASIPIGDCPEGGTKMFSLEVPLPWIIYNSDEGLQFFTTAHATDHGYTIEHGHIHSSNENATVIDFSITRNSLHMLFIGILMFIVFMSVAKGYARNSGKAPKGMQSFFEPIIIFVRDDIAKTYLHGKAAKFTPYLLSLFFFIWFANLLGMTPFNSNIAGNTSFTLALALLSFILILSASTKSFWVHIFWFPGVPLPLKPLMFVVEFMGLLTKPIALAIRLFANISAGHFMVLALISLIFILSNNGDSTVAGFGVAPLSIAFTLFIFGLELIVGLVQAYVFALLTAVFIGQAMETHDDH